MYDCVYITSRIIMRLLLHNVQCYNSDYIPLLQKCHYYRSNHAQYHNITIISESTVYSTFYIGIAMVILPYFGPWELEFSLSVSTQFDFYQHQGGEHVES